MTIAFDLDGTLIPYNNEFPLEPQGWRQRLGRGERLRKGTVQLVLDLQAHGHPVWVYTSSLRSERHIRWVFRLHGVVLDGVINQERHYRELGDRGRHISKFPPAFSIDLLVDDAKDVAIEGKRERFEVLLIDPKDRHWDTRIRELVFRD